MMINTNMSSLISQEANRNTTASTSRSIERLSTGLSINRASDDASGMAIADKLRTQTSSLSQAVANGNSAIALTQIADQAMGEQSKILDIVKSKLLQASTATTGTAGQKAIAKDIIKLLEQLNNIASDTNYNGLQLLQNARGKNDTAQDSSASFTFQMGEFVNSTIKSSSGVRANVIGMELSKVSSAMKKEGTDPIVGNQRQINAQNARALLKHIDKAITKLNEWRADFGSTQNQIESSIRTLNNSITNIRNAESILRDVDYAQESANFNKRNITAQAGFFALSQANAVQANVLKLLTLQIK
jgi:flagellin